MANGIKAGLPMLIASGTPVLAAVLALNACLSISNLGSYTLPPSEASTDGAPPPDAQSPTDAPAPADADAARDASDSSDAPAEAATVVVPPSTAKLSANATSTCAIAAGGIVKCWGDNAYGTLGNGDMTGMPNPLPEPVTGIPQAASLGGGSYVQCVVGATGQTYCWGVCIFGEVSGGGFVSASTSNPYEMTQFGFPANVAATTGGQDFLCMLTRSGAAWCSGTNGSGQLGNDTMTPQGAPVEAQGSLPFVDLSAAFAGVSTCGVSSVGDVQCWGSNSEGQLGGGSPSGSLTPIAVQGLGTGVSVTSVTTGDTHACALTSAGAVWCWGDDSQGQLGQASPSSVPVRVLPSGIQQISAGATQTCALATGGQVTCWGAGNPTPTTVSGLPTDVAYVSAGSGHACAMRSGGAVLCWGDNSFGQLGDGSMTSSTTPVQAMGIP
jgi:alpha-tubulin suppressor-like RCC1 family protein